MKTSWGWARPSSDQLHINFESMAYISCYCALIFLIESSSVSQFEKIMLVKSNWLDKVNQNQVEQIKLKITWIKSS